MRHRRLLDQAYSTPNDVAVKTAGAGFTGLAGPRTSSAMVRCSTDDDSNLRHPAAELRDHARQEAGTMGAQNRLGSCAVGACALAAFAVHACNASAQDSNCLLDIGAVTVSGNVLIATSCELTGTEVRGNVILFAGGSLIARNVRIRGRLEGS